MPGNWKFDATKSGFICTDYFLKWIRETFIPAIDDRRPVCLVLDNHTSHVSTELIECAQANGISLLYLPSNTSHILQPLDVGYFHVLKSHMYSISSALGYAGATVLPRHEFCKVFEQAMNRISRSTVISCFSELGFLPFVKDKVKALPKGNKPTSDAIRHEAKQVDCCPTCSQPTTNILVRSGLIPQSLSHILVPAPVIPAKPSDTSEARAYPAKTTTKRKRFVPPPVVSKAAKPQETAITKEPVAGPSEPTTRADDTEPVAGPSKPTCHDTQPEPMTDGDDSVPEEDLCCVCHRFSPAQFDKTPDLKFYQWIGCDVCDHWVHRKYCTKAVRRNGVFRCIHCIEVEQ